VSVSVLHVLTVLREPPVEALTKPAIIFTQCWQLTSPPHPIGFYFTLNAIKYKEILDVDTGWLRVNFELVPYCGCTRDSSVQCYGEGYGIRLHVKLTAHEGMPVTADSLFQIKNVN